MITGPLLTVFLALVAAWCAAGSKSRKRTAVLIAVLAMLPAWLLPEHWMLPRAVCALLAFTFAMRVADLTRLDWPFPKRVFHVFSVIDSRKLVLRSRRFEIAALLHVAAWAALASVAIYTLVFPPRADLVVLMIARWLAGLVAIYAIVSALYRWLFFQYRLAGYDVPPLHLSPILSRSIQEFWGERWARPISDWLRETFFFRYARKRRAMTGLLLAFSVSAAFHAYAIWVGLGFRSGAIMAAWMFAYFVAQAFVMALERRFRVRDWRPWAGHVWTLAWMVVLAPLFVEPAVRIVGIR